MSLCTSCTTSSSDLNTISRFQYKYEQIIGGISTAEIGPFIYQTIAGPKSNNIYFSEWIIPNSVVIQKTTSDDVTLWIAAYGDIVIAKSLIVDSNEQYVYYGVFQNPLAFVKLSASTGSLVSATQFANIIGEDHNPRTWLLSDNSGYYFAAVNSGTNRLNICKYLFSSPSNVECQEASTMGSSANNQLKLSDSQLFIVSLDPSSPYNLHMYKITYGNTAADWALKINCPTSSCSSANGENLLSDDSTTLYAFFLYGPSSSIYSHFASLNSTNGNIVGTRYFSSAVCSYTDAFALIDNYLVASVRCPSDSNLIIMNIQ